MAEDFDIVHLLREVEQLEGSEVIYFQQLNQRICEVNAGCTTNHYVYFFLQLFDRFLIYSQSFHCDITRDRDYLLLSEFLIGWISVKTFFEKLRVEHFLIKSLLKSNPLSTPYEHVDSLDIWARPDQLFQHQLADVASAPSNHQCFTAVKVPDTQKIMTRNKWP